MVGLGAPLDVPIEPMFFCCERTGYSSQGSADTSRREMGLGRVRGFARSIWRNPGCRLRMVSNDSAELNNGQLFPRFLFSEVFEPSSVLPIAAIHRGGISWLMAQGNALAWDGVSAADYLAGLHYRLLECMRSVKSLAKPSTKRGFPCGAERMEHLQIHPKLFGRRGVL